MLFYVKQHARIAAPVMIGLILVSNLWANVRGIDLGQAFSFDLLSMILAALGLGRSARGKFWQPFGVGKRVAEWGRRAG